MILAKFWCQGLFKDASGFPFPYPRICTRAQRKVSRKGNGDLSTSCSAMDSVVMGQRRSQAPCHGGV